MKIKNKLLTILFIFALFMSYSITAFADYDGSGTGDDGPQATQKVVGGPSSQKTGWLLYLVDWNGNQISETQVIYEYRVPNECNTFYPRTRFGGSINYSDYEVGSPWGYGPFNSDATGNGSQVKSWMLQETEDVYNVYWVTYNYLGAEAAETFKSGDCVLMVEALFWAQMYRDDIGATGIYLCASAYGWAKTQIKIGVGDYGSKAIGKYTNNIFPNCVKLESPIYFGGIKHKK